MTYTDKRAWKGSSTLVERYAELDPDGHYFDDETMDFFKSRVHDIFRSASGNWFFVTSEKGPNMVRAYSVRHMDNETGKIETHGPFNVSTHARCRNVAKALANRDIELTKFSSMSIACDYVVSAKQAWEFAGGSIDTDTESKRKSAEIWAEPWKIHWALIHPEFERDGKVLAWGEWCELYGFDLIRTGKGGLLS